MFRVEGSGSRVWGCLGFMGRDEGLGFKDEGLGFRDEGLGLRDV